MKIKHTVINNRIVPANWFIRQWERIWDFIYFKILPLRAWRKIKEWRDEVKYAFQRAFKGYDERISWGHESTIKFYKAMLSELHKHVHGYPCNLKNICPEEWDKLEKKWGPKLPEGVSLEDTIIDSKEVFGDESEMFWDDCFNCWKDYIARVLHYFEEADPDTCSLAKEVDELYGKFSNPFDESKRTVVEHNGEYFYQYPSLGDSPEDMEQRRILDRLREIEKYQADQLRLGMEELAKNVMAFGD